MSVLDRSRAISMLCLNNQRSVALSYGSTQCSSLQTLFSLPIDKVAILLIDSAESDNNV